LGEIDYGKFSNQGKSDRYLAIYRGGVIVYAGGRQISATVLPDSYGHLAEIELELDRPLRRAGRCSASAGRPSGIRSAFYRGAMAGPAVVPRLR